ncbi:MAG: putative 4-hydroxybutyrate CoA-transferase [Ilumatobacteraceae bacterium]|nr:putative 4-hydroxybutyrate CoA-transferase [Ilumatobacteraceae bacterium]
MCAVPLRLGLHGAVSAGRSVIEPSPPAAVLEHIAARADIIVPIANGEPVTLLDAIERHESSLSGVRVHQMHALHDRPYLHGSCGDRLRHVSYFLSHVTRPCFRAGTIDLVPNNFSEMRAILQGSTSDPLVVASASPPDRHGYFSLGSNADYVASFIGRARFFLEANQQMPRTFGRNQIHISQVVGWSEADYPLAIVAPPSPTEADLRIAGFVAERVLDRSTIQVGIGAIPNAILSALTEHRDLGIHTELISDGVMDLVEAGVVNGVAKELNRTKTVGTFALGTQRLYEFLHENTAFELWPVRYVNDPRVIAQETDFVSINSTIAVDLIGQCASETVAGSYYSSSGGQADFARGAMYSPGGQGFVVLHSTTKDATISKIVPQLAAGDVVTTLKNTVDKVVTEWGVAELRGRSIRARAGALIAIAHPAHRESLAAEARRLGYI